MNMQSGVSIVFDSVSIISLVVFVLQFFLQFHFKMEKLTPMPSGPMPPMGVKRPPPLMSNMGPRPPHDPMPPPPPV